MSSYSWQFYAARRRVSLRGVAESNELKTYEDFCAWCARNKIQPPDEALYSEQVKGLFQSSRPAKVETKVTPAPKPTQAVDESPAPAKKSTTRRGRSSKKSPTKAK